MKEPSESFHSVFICYVITYRPLSVFYDFKFLFRCSAERADKFSRQVFKPGPRCNTIVRISFGFIINPAANFTSVFFHTYTSAFHSP